MAHIPVLLHETVASLNIRSDAVVIDATFGSGGHAREIVSLLGKGGLYLGIDVDETALKVPYEFLETSSATIHRVCANFQEIDTVAKGLGISKVDAVMADLGWRIEQFTGETGERGFSFMHEEPLVMTFGSPESYAFTAHDIVNSWQEEDIANVIYGYGEETYARKIAKAIVSARAKKEIVTTHELAALITATVGRRGKVHPATKTFQALRIAVNDELGVLESLLEKGFDLLREGGRMSIITFHSIEDRIVKHFNKRVCAEGHAQLTNKKPITPTPEEEKQYPRSRSAKLRTIEKI